MREPGNGTSGKASQRAVPKLGRPAPGFSSLVSGSWASGFNGTRFLEKMASPPQEKPGAQQICLLLLCGVSWAGRDHKQFSVMLTFQGSWTCESLCEFEDFVGSLVGMSIAGQVTLQILGDSQPGLGRPGHLWLTASLSPGSHQAVWLVRPRLSRLSAHMVLGHLSSE